MLIYPLNFLLYLLRFLDFLFTSVITLLCSLLPDFMLRSFFPSLYRAWSRSFVRVFGIRERIHHMYREPLPSNYIMISNHPAGIDVIWLPGRFKVRPLSKDSFSTWPVIGSITRNAGVMFVNRENAASRNASLRACIKAVKGGDSILIFPEGGCLGKSLSPFQNGAFDISLKTKTPVVPVYLHYEEEDTYEWGDISTVKYILRLLFRPANRTAHLYIFDAVNPDAFETAAEYKSSVFAFYKSLEKKYRL